MAGGPFSSSSESRQTTTNTAQNTGFSEVAGPAQSANVNVTGKVKTKGGDLVVNLTDQGAVNAAMAAVDASIRSVEQLSHTITGVVEAVVASIAGQGENVIEAVTSANKSAIGAVSEANRTELENLGLAAIKWGALALAGYLAARAMWSMAK